MIRTPPDRAGSALRVMFAGGTSGGHLMPGVAVAKALRELMPAARCLFLLGRRSAEDDCRGVLNGFEVADVPDTPWAGALSKALFPARCTAAAARVGRALRRFRPHVLVALGSYNSAVPLALARALGLPCALFEANAVPGRLVRALAPLADVVMLQWAGVARRLTCRRALATGNPVRPELFGVSRAGARDRLGLARNRFTLLALGGSQGARGLNRLVRRAVRRIEAPLQVLHVAGNAHLEDRGGESSSAIPCRTVGFLDRMEDGYAAADLVLSRAGASTLAELTALGLPAILVPHPYSPNRHQQANAAVLQRAGAAIVKHQAELTPRRLAHLVERLAADPERLQQMAERARRLGRPDAARRVARELAHMAGSDTNIRPVPERMGLSEHRKLHAA
ncbi:MAG: UDP-N-acetylglucosamine--N-acetylmuramyl-(pentapeptide) pyrophosphoryl-undecaprenol N-acetylglucosamine transferase [Candidatus Brocadiia bacterium]